MAEVGAVAGQPLHVAEVVAVHHEHEVPVGELVAGELATTMRDRHAPATGLGDGARIRPVTDVVARGAGAVDLDHVGQAGVVDERAMTASAAGDRQMLPRHTKQTLIT